MGPLATDLAMNIVINNEGVSSFDKSAAKFFAVINGVKYKYQAAWTQQFGDWNSNLLPGGENYAGTIFFNVPRSDSLQAYTLFYENSSNCNIVYVSK
jgi:hypothetical protein